MRKNKMTTIISVLLLTIALFSTLFLDEYWGSRLTNVITISTAIIGAVALFFQFKRDKDINQANFIVEFWKSFSGNKNLQKIMIKCDTMHNTGKNEFVEDDYFDILSYAQWLETLASIINKKIVNFDTINDMYGYMYFVFVNNKYVQDIELKPNEDYYHGIFTVYNKWVEYCKENNVKMIGDKTPLIKQEVEDKKENNK